MGENDHLTVEKKIEEMKLKTNIYESEPRKETFRRHHRNAYKNETFEIFLLKMKQLVIHFVKNNSNIALLNIFLLCFTLLNFSLFDSQL